MYIKDDSVVCGIRVDVVYDIYSYYLIRLIMVYCDIYRSIYLIYYWFEEGCYIVMF